MAFPKVTQLPTHTPGDYGDVYFIRWTLLWDAHALTDNPTAVFNANMFWPAKNTLAYSDSLLSVATIAQLLRAILGDPLGFNVLYLSTWVLALVGAYLLLMWIVNHRPSALIGAVFFAFSTPRLAQLGHVNLAFSCLIPLNIYLLFRFLERKTLTTALGLGAVFASTALASAHHGILLLIALPLIFLGWLIAERRSIGGEILLGALLAAVLAAVILVPVALNYLELQNDPAFQRESGDEYSAHFGDLLAPASGNYLYKSLGRKADDAGLNVERRLFLGFVAPAFALVGILAAVRSKPAGVWRDHRRRAALLLLVSGVIAFVLAFGRFTYVGETYVGLPFGLLADHVPGFAGVRAPSRFMPLAVLSLGLLIAVGFRALTGGRNRTATGILAIVVAGMILAEHAASVPIVPDVKASNRRVYQYLAKAPEGAVVELPMGDPDSGFWAEVEAPRMFLSSIDWKPRVNGYSGFFPPGYYETLQLSRLLTTGEAEPALRSMMDMGVRYLIVHTSPPVDYPPGSPALEAGASHYDLQTSEQIVGSIPASRRRRVRRIGDAILIELREPA